MSLSADHFIQAVKNRYNFITNKEVAEHFGVTRARISQWLQANKIPLKYISAEGQAISDSEGKSKFYQEIIKKQLDHIALLEKEIKEFNNRNKIFYKEVVDNWGNETFVTASHQIKKVLQDPESWTDDMMFLYELNGERGNCLIDDLIGQEVFVGNEVILVTE